MTDENRDPAASLGSSSFRTPTDTLASAIQVIARDVGGLAKAAIDEAACRLLEQSDEISRLRSCHAAWISVSDGLPDHGGTVLCKTTRGELVFGRVMTTTRYSGQTPRHEHKWVGYPSCDIDVSWWSPLPRGDD
jgi:hypothetical protein